MINKELHEVLNDQEALNRGLYHYANNSNKVCGVTKVLVRFKGNLYTVIASWVFNQAVLKLRFF